MMVWVGGEGYGREDFEVEATGWESGKADIASAFL